MKRIKKWIVMAVAALTVCCCSAGLAACGSNSEHEHIWGSATTTQATCDTDGSIVKTCECGSTNTSIIPAYGHAYSKGKCTRCDAIDANWKEEAPKEEPDTAHVHTFGEKELESEATCEKGSVYVRECTDIYCDVVDKEILSDWLGHAFRIYPGKAETCEEIGWLKYQVCDRCEYSTYVEKSALGHDLVAYEGKTETCVSDGWKEYEACSRCELTTYEKIPAFGHSYENGVCITCGDPNHPELWDEGRVTLEPTCVQAGITEYVCECGAIKEEVIDPLGHDKVHHDGQDPTCLVGGWTEYDTCTRCDYSTRIDRDPLGHDVFEHDKQEPDCLNFGWEAYETCNRLDCDYTTYVEIPALGHTIMTKGAQEPDCLNIGWDAYEYCAVCDYTTYVEIPAFGHTMVNMVCTECGYSEKTEQLFLSANVESVILNGSSSYKIVFYAQLVGDFSVSSVVLYDTEGESYGTMYDDGAYSSNGDELSNDNVFTRIVMVSVSEETTLNCYAYLTGESNLESNDISIAFINNISEEEFEEMAAVDNTIETEIFAAENFETLTLEEKKQLAEDNLSQMAEEEFIKEDTICFNDVSSTYTFQYSSGALGAIVLDDLYGAQEDLDSALNGVGSLSGAALYSDNQTDLVALNTIGSEDLSNANIDAMILWSFNLPQDNPSFRVGFYEETEQLWEEKGVDTTVDWDVTVNDYKNLSQYEIIVISGHGTHDRYTIGGISRILPSIVLSERATEEKDRLYAEDLKMQRIGKVSLKWVGTIYTILPDFWTYYYSNGDLDGSFVFSESCQFAGKNGIVDNRMLNSILSCSAESVIGFHNSVMAKYSRNLMRYYVDSLIAGYETETALEMAKSVYGKDDDFFGRILLGPVAYPIFSGNANSKLVSLNLENGSFEDKVALSGWEKEGDVRVLSQLSTLKPQDGSKMAILTTGIGSGESGYLEATEGSVLYQTFTIEEGQTTLAFYYNVVSEEPHEWVGSQYDDKFYAEIICDGISYDLAAESVNKSEWYTIDGIDFDGGDGTTYHTGWQFVEFDISQFKNKNVTLRFVVYDVGDSIYDTAALIDNVALH